jgi:hypothetical protein
VIKMDCNSRPNLRRSRPNPSPLFCNVDLTRVRSRYAYLNLNVRSVRSRNGLMHMYARLRACMACEAGMHSRPNRPNPIGRFEPKRAILALTQVRAVKVSR